MERGEDAQSVTDRGRGQDELEVRACVREVRGGERGRSARAQHPALGVQDQMCESNCVSGHQRAHGVRWREGWSSRGIGEPSRWEGRARTTTTAARRASTTAGKRLTTTEGCERPRPVAEETRKRRARANERRVAGWPAACTACRGQIGSAQSPATDRSDRVLEFCCVVARWGSRDGGVVDEGKDRDLSI